MAAARQAGGRRRTAPSSGRGRSRQHRSTAGSPSRHRRRPRHLPVREPPASQVARAVRSSPSQTRSAVAPTPIRPRSGRPRMSAGSRVAASTAERRSTPAATTLAIAASSRSPEPAMRAVRPAGQAERVDRDLLAAQVVRPRRHPGGRDRVGDQHDPARRGGEGEPADRRGHVVQVGDQPAGQPRVGEALPDHAGLPVVQRAHRVEQVGDQPGAGVRGRLGLGRGGVAVPDADQHAGLDQPADRRPARRDAPAPACASAAARARPRAARRSPPGWGRAAAPGRARRAGCGARNGPSTCTPSTRAPPRSAGSAAVRRSAATSSGTGAVMKVGRNAVTPVSGSRRATSAQPAGSAATKSTPKHPLIWMSTRPGTSTPDGRSTSGRTPPYVSPAATPTIRPSRKRRRRPVRAARRQRRHAAR